MRGSDATLGLSWKDMMYDKCLDVRGCEFICRPVPFVCGTVLQPEQILVQLSCMPGYNFGVMHCGKPQLLLIPLSLKNSANLCNSHHRLHISGFVVKLVGVSPDLHDWPQFAPAPGTS